MATLMRSYLLRACVTVDGKKRRPMRATFERSVRGCWKVNARNVIEFFLFLLPAETWCARRGRTLAFLRRARIM